MTDRDAQWFRSRLPAYDAGLLGEADAERFESLLQRDEYARIYQSYVADEEPRTDSHEHISPELIARWPDLQESVRGLERKMIRSHLEGCSQCRQDLELLGYEPALAFRADLEQAPAEEAEEGHAVLRPQVDIVTIASQGRHLWRWLAGGWAAAAVAAAGITLILVRGGVDPGAGTMFVGDPAPATVQLYGDTRGSGADDLPRVHVPNDTRMISLDLTNLNVGVGAVDLETMEIVIEIVTPRGSGIGPVRTTAAAISGNPLIVTSGDEPFAAGEYTLRIRPDDLPPVAYRFLVETP